MTSHRSRQLLFRPWCRLDPVSLFGAFPGARPVCLLSGLIAAGLVAFAPGGVLAQTGANVPETVSGFDPSGAERSFETEPEPLASPEALPLPEVTGSEAPEAAGGITLTLSEIVIEGAESLDVEADLSPLWQDLIGQDVALSRVFALAEDITAWYRNKGFILTRAVVPAQKIKDGRITLRVVEGFINSVSFSGDTDDDMTLLRAHAKAIQDSRPLTSDVLERHLLLINDLSGMQARAVMAPADGVTGGTDLTLVLTRDSFDYQFAVDNRGTDYVGPIQYSLSGTANSLLGYHEKIQVLGVMANGGHPGGLIDSDERELLYGSLTYLRPYSAKGTSWQLTLSASDSSPGDAIADFDIDGTVYSGGLSFVHPFIRSRRQNLTGRAGLSFRHTKTDWYNDDDTDQEDKLRIANLGVTWDFVDSYKGISLFDFELSQGLPILWASEAGDPELTRSRGRPDFTKIVAKAQRLQHIGYGFNLLVAMQGQYALDPLLSSEEFALGGATWGRAYDSSTLTGDHGVAARAELRFQPNLDLEPVNAPELYLFGDIGKVWEEEHDTAETRAMASAGGGIRFGLMDRLSAEIEAAFPLTMSVSGEDDDYEPRLFFKLVIRDE